MKFICLSAILCVGVSGAVTAQELRKPDEVKEIIIESTYPVRIAVEVTPDDKLYVWVGYTPVYKTDPEEGYHLAGFLADKLNIYESGKLVREISDLLDIPDPKSIKSSAIGYAIDMFPHINEDGANKIVLSTAAGNALLGLGFLRNEMTLGPFAYQVNGVRTMIQADKGLLYVKAYCSDRSEEVKKNDAWRPFVVLFTLNRKLKLVDSFIYRKVKERDPHEMYPSDGWSFLSDTGNFYEVNWEGPANTIKLEVRKWRLKHK